MVLIASIINPYEVKPKDDILVVVETKRQSFFEMLGEYILDGFKVGVIVCAMLTGFVGIITLINNVFLGIIGNFFPRNPRLFILTICLLHGNSNGRMCGCC